MKNVCPVHFPEKRSEPPKIFSVDRPEFEKNNPGFSTEAKFFTNLLDMVSTKPYILQQWQDCTGRENSRKIKQINK